MTHDGEAVGVNGRPMDPRMQKMGPYPVFVPNAPRDQGWPAGVGQSASSVNEQQQENGTATHSPAFMPSPTVTSAEMPYGPRYPTMDMHKNVLPSIDTAPYVFNDRSISPAGSSPHTGSQASVSSQFPFVYPADGSERADGDYRRHPAQAPEMTLHGGTADISAYAANRRRVISNGPDRPMLGGLAASFRQGEEDRNFAEAESKAGPSDVRAGARRPRRNTTGSAAASHSSRSPSPSHPPISSTLAVIKAQAFGALRRTRARPKKSTEGAAKMAMEVLEARGIGLGISTGNSHKRQRLHDDEQS
jgi:hypothetical protein